MGEDPGNKVELSFVFYTIKLFHIKQKRIQNVLRAAKKCFSYPETL